MWCVAVAEARVPVDRRPRRGVPGVNSPLVDLHRDDLVVADAVDVDDLAGGAVGCEPAGVGDLAAALGVEEALLELHQHAAVGARIGRDGHDGRRCSRSS